MECVRLQDGGLSIIASNTTKIDFVMDREGRLDDRQPVEPQFFLSSSLFPSLFSPLFPHYYPMYLGVCYTTGIIVRSSQLIIT